MSNDKTEVIPTVAPVPTRRSVLRAARAGQPASQPERSPFAGWRDRTPTEELPAVSPATGRPATGRPAPSRRERTASQPGAAGTAAGMAFPRVSTLTEPTRGRVARRTAPTGTKGLRRQSRQSRHLRAALAALALAAAILIPMQLFAAQGIADARQAALTARPDRASHTQPEQASPEASPEASPATTLSGQSTHAEQVAPSPMSGQSPAQPEWVTEHTGAAYDRTNPHASPLDLPRCTTSPDTPLPCLATISPDSRRAVVLEEDASLTALVHR